MTQFEKGEARHSRLTIQWLSLRLRWYGVETGRRIRRYWKAILLAFALLSPLAMPVVEQSRLFGSPVLVLFDPKHSAVWRFIWLAVLECAAAAWLVVQYDAVSGGRFVAFWKSLPVSPRVIRFTHIAVLLLANTPIFAPVVAAGLVFASEANPILHALCLLDIVCAVLVAQVALLERRHRWLASLLCSNGLLAIALAIGLTPVTASAATTATAATAVTTAQKVIDGNAGPYAIGAQPMLVALVVLAVACLIGTLASARPQRFASTVPAGVWTIPGRSGSARPGPRRSGPMPNIVLAMEISLRILFDTCRAATFARLAVLGACVASAIALMQIWGFDARSMPLVLIVDACVAMIVAGAFRDLNQVHARSASYVSALPLPSGLLARADIVAVSITGMLPALVLAAAVALHRDAHSAIKCLSSVFLLVPLIACLRVPVTRIAEHALVIAGLLATAWVMALWHFLL